MLVPSLHRNRTTSNTANTTKPCLNLSTPPQLPSLQNKRRVLFAPTRKTSPGAWYLELLLCLIGDAVQQKTYRSVDLVSDRTQHVLDLIRCTIHVITMSLQDRAQLLEQISRLLNFRETKRKQRQRHNKPLRSFGTQHLRPN